MTPIVQGQMLAVRFVAHLIALTPDRRVHLGDAVTGGGDAPRAAAQQLGAAASTARTPLLGGPDVDLESFFAALDALVVATVSDPVLCAAACDVTRGLIVHADPAYRDAFATLYAPIAAVIPFESLLLE